MSKQRIVPFLTFTGKSEEAMNYYAKNLPEAKIEKLIRYGEKFPGGGEETENLVLHGSLSFMGQEIMFLDMDSANPAPDFSWATSIFIECNDEAEFDTIFKGLSQDGKVMMEPEAVANFRKCAWVVDKFGVTWQPVWE
ncbi:MAG: VOC family protein [Defluviitaleaceae bacterium]|nr:VOC family protein [Defluviitaleaceae bacterium]